MSSDEDEQNDGGTRLNSRVGNIIQGIAILAIVGLAVDAVNVRIAVAVSREQIQYLIEANQQQAELWSGVLDHLAVKGFNAQQGIELTKRVDENTVRIERHREAPDHPGAKARLTALEARIDYLIRQIERTGDDPHYDRP